MSKIRSSLTKLFSDAFASAGASGDYGQVETSRRPELGQFQCNGALAAAKKLKMNPRIIAEKVVAFIEDNPLISEISLAGPGFINIMLDDKVLSDAADEIAADVRKGCLKTQNPKKIVMDYGGPNVAKALHVGHLRSSIIGDSINRILSFKGHDTISDVHLGDWGRPMGMLIEELKLEQPELSYFDENFEGDYPETSPVTISELDRLYPQATIRCKDDDDVMEAARKALVELHDGRKGYRALWQHFVDISVMDMKIGFKALNVSFDEWLGESDVHDVIPKMVEDLTERGIAFKDDGALIIPVAKDSDTHDIPPMILLKSDGTAIYATTDLATLIDRVDNMKADEIIYVTDRRQSLHFEQVFRAAEKAGYVNDVKLKHIGYGTMNGEDGTPFKTRSGGVMKLGTLIDMTIEKAYSRMEEAGIAADFDKEERDDIAEKIALAAIRFSDLIHDAGSDYAFSLDNFTRFEGKTGPYLVYAAVRAKALLKRAYEEKGLKPAKTLPPETDAERNLILRHDSFATIIDRAARDYAPHQICDFAFALSQDFNSFYQNCHILSMNDKKRQESWLTLVKNTMDQIEIALSLIGIETPERM